MLLSKNSWWILFRQIHCHINYHLWSTRMIKQRITSRKHHTFCKLMIFCCLTKTNSRLLLFIPLLMFLRDLCDTNCTYCPCCFNLFILGPSKTETIGLKQRFPTWVMYPWGYICLSEGVGQGGYSRHFFAFSTIATLFQVQTSSKFATQ